MKLLQLLAKELKEWPSSNPDSVGQAVDGTLYYLCNGSGACYARSKKKYTHNTDHATAIVTRADWEAEKARIAGKADGGWKRHKGVKQPVADGVKVEIRTRGGDFEVCSADGFAWGATGNSQIMTYRIHNPVEQPAIEPAVVENVQAFNAQAELLYDPVAQGQLQWRDRIYELDTQRAELEATYQRQIGEIDGERGELVERLAGEGLALVEVVQAVEDMSYPHNWKQGDVLLCEDSKSGHYTTGKLYKFICISPYGSARSIDDRGRENGLMPKFFKWHSRPAS